MSLSSLFYDHPLIFGCSLFLAGLSSGIAVEKFFSDRVNQIENVSKQELSTDVLQLQDTVNSQHQSIQALTSELSAALLHKDLKCKAPLIEPNLRRNLGKWST